MPRSALPLLTASLFAVLPVLIAAKPAPPPDVTVGSSFVNPVESLGGLNPAFGFSTTHGDFNGDGWEDVVIGDQQADFAVVDDVYGAVSVYPGSAAGFGAEPTQIFFGREVWEYFGAEVACAGDVNGDGYDDVLISGYLTRDASFLGRSALYFGSSSGLVEAAAAEFDGSFPNAYLKAVSLGDVNADGYADVMVSMSADGTNPARQDLYLGEPSGLPATPSMSFNAGSGLVVSSFGVGDLNGDGYADVIITDYEWSNYVGQGLVYEGGPDGLHSSGVTITGDGEFLGFGGRISGGGDVNGDGYDDVLAAAIGDASLKGAVYLYAGSASGLVSSPVLTLVGEFQEAYFGMSTSMIGDVNGDGYADFAVHSNGVDREAAQLKRGVVQVYEGGAVWPSAPGFVLVGTQDYTDYGSPTGGGGDVDNDGDDDMLVSRMAEERVDLVLGWSESPEDSGDSGDSGDRLDTGDDRSGADPQGCGCTSTPAVYSPGWLMVAAAFAYRRRTQTAGTRPL